MSKVVRILGGEEDMGVRCVLLRVMRRMVEVSYSSAVEYLLLQDYQCVFDFD